MVKGLEKVKCQICQQDNCRILFHKDGYTYVKCKECGLVYLNPQPSVATLRSTYKNFGKEYYLSKEKLKIDFSIDHRERLEKLKQFRKTGKLLDVGCSTGAFLVAARNDGWDVYGCEISKYSSQYAQEEKGLNVFTGELTQANYKEADFDVITFWAVLEHVPNIFGYLSETYRILRPGGAVAISVPNWRSLSIILLGPKYRYITHTHLFYFTPRSISYLLKKIGFCKIEVQTKGFNPLVFWEDFRGVTANSIRTHNLETNIVASVRKKWYYPLVKFPYKVVGRMIGILGWGEELHVLAIK